MVVRQLQFTGLNFSDIGGMIMYYVDINDNIIVGKAHNSYSDDMVEVSEEIYNMIETLPTRAEIDVNGDIVSVKSINTQEELDLLENLKPTEDELLGALLELKVIDLLLELGVI